MTRINTLDEMKDHFTEGHASFVIALMGGAAVSRKEIRPRPEGRLEVFHGIDGRFEELAEHELFTETNIGEAMQRGIFFCED